MKLKGDRPFVYLLRLLATAGNEAHGAEAGHHQGIRFRLRDRRHRDGLRQQITRLLRVIDAGQEHDLQMRRAEIEVGTREVDRVDQIVRQGRRRAACEAGTGRPAGCATEGGKAVVDGRRPTSQSRAGYVADVLEFERFEVVDASPVAGGVGGVQDRQLQGVSIDCHRLKSDALIGQRISAGRRRCEGASCNRSCKKGAGKFHKDSNQMLTNSIELA